MIEVIKIAFDSADYQKALDIRREVFVEGQGVPLEDEVDEFESIACHYLAKLDGKAAGASRWREVDGKIKCERFAVLEEFRGRGVGAALIEKQLKDLKAAFKSDAKVLMLHSQLNVIPLYSKFGFEVVGDTFMECDIAHKTMTRML